MSGSFALIGMIMMLGEMGDHESPRRTSLVLVYGQTTMLWALGLGIGIVLLKQQNRLDQVEEELVRLKSAVSPPQPQQS
jgi:hypothetical protein